MGNLPRLIQELSEYEDSSFESISGQPGAIGARSISSPQTGIAVKNSYLAPKSAAMFDILISRPTANINAPLPVPLFGPIDAKSDWIEILGQLLPAGVTYVVGRGDNKKDLLITYSLLNATDIVTISCNETPYVNFLESLNTSVVNMSQLKMQINNVANQAQFSQPVKEFTRTQFGKNDNQTWSPNQFKSELQNQNDIRTMPLTWNIDQMKTTVITMYNTPSNVVTLNSFVQTFERVASAGTVIR